MCFFCVVWIFREFDWFWFLFQGDICKWRISATNGEKIILNVTQLDIPPSHGCHSDFLEIRDGYWHRSELLGIFWKNLKNFFNTLFFTTKQELYFASLASNKVFFTVRKFQNFSATFYVKLILAKLRSQNRPTLTDLAALNFHTY